MSDYIVETIEGKYGITGEVRYDEDCESPREDDNFGILFADSRDFVVKEGDLSLGQLQDIVAFKNGEWESPYFEKDEDGYGEEYAEMEVIADSVPVILPFYLYSHSGISVSVSGFSCPWDSGQIGVYYVTAEKLKAERVTEEKAIEIMQAEIKNLDEYVTGQCYYYCVKDSEGEILDSCGGYIGELDYVISEMKTAIEYHEKEVEKLDWMKEVYHI